MTRLPTSWTTYAKSSLSLLKALKSMSNYISPTTASPTRFNLIRATVYCESLLNMILLIALIFLFLPTYIPTLIGNMQKTYTTTQYFYTKPLLKVSNLPASILDLTFLMPSITSPNIAFNQRCSILPSSNRIPNI